MFIDTPPAIVYEIPSNNAAIVTEIEQKEERAPICVQAFGQAPDYGVPKPNTKVFFYHLITETMNSRIVNANYAGINQQSHSSWALHMSGLSSVTTEFQLAENEISEDLGLYLIHLSSDLHRGTYDSAIRILVNDHVLVEKYVPASHDWIYDDHFSLKKIVKQGVLQPGTNRIEIQLHEDARSQYWLHKLMVK